MVENGTCWQAEILQRPGSFSETVRPLKILRPKSGPTFTRRAILPRFSPSPLHNRGLPVCRPNSSQGLPPPIPGPHAHHPSPSRHR